MMNTLTLQRNVQFLYEDHIARLELEALGCSDVKRSIHDWGVLSAHVNGNATAIRTRSAYIGHLDEQPSVYQQLIQPNYQGGRFNRTRSVNQYLTHWIYPYRGKFHPQMVRALFNLIGVRQGARVCEPFLGSGTAALESSLLGADCVGVDLSPVCVLLTRVKVSSVHAVAAIGDRVRQLLAGPTLDMETLDPRRERNMRVREFLSVARLVTASDVARRSKDADVSLRKNLTAMLQSVEAHALAVREFGLTLGEVTASVGDARDLAAAGIDADSIDGIVTSPPYSIALDYVKNDEHALDLLEVDTAALRTTMTGVRGRGATQKLALYNDDMKKVFAETARILKSGARAAYVVGDATVDGREVTTTETMTEWGVRSGLVHEQTIKKIVFGLYNVMLDERIVVFRKP